MFEVDGLKNPVYCENLCYLSKLYLDHKNLYWDMTPFLFFVLCEFDDKEYHITGYFSKEKESQNGYNLSCILVLPFYQRKGYGKFLISFSYELSLKEGKLGSPERPLSDLGRASYLSWWTQRLIEYMRKYQGQSYSVQDISRETGITEVDLFWTMEQQGIIRYHQNQSYVCTDADFLNELFKKAGQVGKPLKPENIRWVPFRYRW